MSCTASLLALALASQSPVIAAGDAVDVSPRPVAGEGWSQVRLVGETSRTEIDASGTIVTTREPWDREESGVLPLDIWNDLARDLNSVAESHAEGERLCWSPASSDESIAAEAAEIVFDDSAQSTLLFEQEADRLCGPFTDEQLARRLYSVLGILNSFADAEAAGDGGALQAE